MSVNPALTALFNTIVAGGNTTWCDFDLYTITPVVGSVVRFTTADFDILAGGNLYSSGGVRVDHKQSKVQAHWKVGLDADTWVVVFMPRPVDPVSGATFPDTIGGVPWLQAASSGALDAADFQVDRAYFASVPTWPMPPGGAVPVSTRTIFAGVIGQLDMSDTTVVLTVNDYRSLFLISMPLHFYQAQCRHMLGDAGCTINLASFGVSGVAGAGSTQSMIVAPLLGAPGGSGTYTLGTVKFTSGLNAGYQQTVTSWQAPNLRMTQPFPFAVAPGDTFTAYPGCDWQMATCSLFNNIANFGGFPYIPAPETAT